MDRSSGSTRSASSSTERPGRLRRALAASMLVGVSVLIGFALGEIGLRAIGFSYPSLYVPDDVTGARLRAGAEGWNHSEGTAYVTINSRGLRDREHAVAKPDGVYRIAVLGDSYAEALQVDLEETFWSRLPEKLENCGFAQGKRIEPINFGVSGYGTAQELLTLRQRVWDYSPDLVLVAFFPGNDIRNNSRVLESERLRPFFELRNGELVLDQSFLSDPAYHEVKHLSAQRVMLQDLKIYQLLRKLRAGYPVQKENSPIAIALADHANSLPSFAEKGLDENVFRKPAVPAQLEAWTVTEQLLVGMDRETRAHNAAFLVVVVSSPPAVYPDSKIRQRYADYLGEADLLYPEARIERLGAQHGFSVLALAPEMQRYADATHTYLHGFPNGKLGFGHWNQAGHELAATLVARHLCTR